MAFTEAAYEEGLRTVKRGLVLLGVITIAEVLFALFANGHLVHGFHLPKFITYPVMIFASLYKAYWIVYNFMHMGHEVKGMAMSILLPMLLLVWAIIAFFQEGGSWGHRRELIEEKDARQVKPAAPKPTGLIYHIPARNRG